MVAKTQKKQWPAFNIERRKVAALKPSKSNARTHSEEQIGQIAASIKLWGWTQPILIDSKGGVIAGHGRLLAAKELGIVEVPVIVAEGWTKEEKRAYLLADNQLALNADWDFSLLRVEIGELIDGGFDIGLAGFDKTDLASIFLDREEGETDPQAEWSGMPEFDSEDKSAFRTLHVHFKDQAAVAQFEKALGRSLPDKVKYLWYPQIEINSYADKEYSADDVRAEVPDLHTEQGPLALHDHVKSSKRNGRNSQSRRRAAGA